MATGTPRFAPAFGNFNITLRNAAASDIKSVAEKELTLVIERYGRVLQSFDVINGDRRVAEVCESVRHNDRLALTASARRGYRPVLDIVITPGVDMALVSIHKNRLRSATRADFDLPRLWSLPLSPLIASLVPNPADVRL